LDRIFRATVKENKRIISNHYLLTLHPLKRISRPRPGQFFMISICNGFDPLLRRPFSIYRWLGYDFQILYRVTGKGTGMLRDRAKGDTLEVLGPLGNGFPLNKYRDKGIILLAGGLGIASIYALAEAYQAERPILFYGGRAKKDLLNLGELKAMGIKVLISTDDGSRGYKGMVTDYLKKFLSRSTERGDRYCLFACGPRAMLKEVSGIAMAFGMEGYISLEENMACGIGTCLGCAVDTTGGYKRVCMEGPVFSVEEVIW